MKKLPGKTRIGDKVLHGYCRLVILNIWCCLSIDFKENHPRQYNVKLVLGGVTGLNNNESLYFLIVVYLIYYPIVS